MLFLHPSDEAYGSDRVLLRMAIGMKVRGWRVGVLLSDDQPTGWLTEKLGGAAIEVQRGPLAPARRQYLGIRGLPAYLHKLIRARRWVRGAARRFRPSVIHVNTSALLVASIIGRPSGAAVTWHVHELVVRPRVANWVFRLAPTLTADHVIAVSRAVRDHITPHALGRAKVTVVWNGIEDRPAVPTKDGGQETVAFIGRLNRWKGWDVFVRAVAMVARDNPSARFLVVGDPPTGEEWRSPQLRELVSRLALDARLEVRGFEEDVPALIERVAIVVVPSIWPEPFGLVTLEAMRAGKAVIATSHGGALDLIESGASGLLVKPGDPGALAVAIGSLLADREFAARLGDAARKRARAMFSDEAFLDGIERVSIDVIAR